MGFPRFSALVDAAGVDGATRTFSWRKTPVVVTTQGIWHDLSMSPGNPIPNYYASTPLVARRLVSTEGLYHGGDVAPATKHLAGVTVMPAGVATGLPLTFLLCDYLLYYPFVDQGTTDEQFLDNTSESAQQITRYTNGVGVQVMPVLLFAQTGGQTFRITYRDQNNVLQTSQTVTCNTSTSTGAILSTAPATAGCPSPFIPLASGSTGVRRVESFQMVSGSDVGVLALVLVKPLAEFQLRGIDAPVERCFCVDTAFTMPRIQDGAYLNLLALPSGNLSGTPMHGLISTVWR